MSRKSQSICLLGYMGSGKSTIGLAIAQKLDRSFYDLDSLIEEGEGRTISEIFELYGDYYFRNVERQYLHRVLESDSSVISLGGGTPCFFDNIKYINKYSKSFFLRLTPKELAIRLKDKTHSRPLIADKSDVELQDFITAELDKRRRFYEKADLIIDNISIDGTVGLIVKNVEGWTSI